MLIWLGLIVVVAIVGYLVYAAMLPPLPKKEIQPEPVKETVLVPPVIDSSKMKHGPVPVYFATQTATAQRYAYELVEAAQEKSIYCKPANFKDLDVEELKKEKFAIFIIATHYEGEPPDDAAPKWEELAALKAEGQLNGLNYLMFALGDLTYKHYCGFGKNVDNKLKELGANSIHELGTGSNDQNKIDTFFEKWLEGIWGDVRSNSPINPAYDGDESAPVATTISKRFDVSVNTKAQLFDTSGQIDPKGFDTNAARFISCYDAKIRNVKELRQIPHEHDSTLHFDLELPEGKSFKTAGNIILFPENSPENVKKALECVSLKDSDVLVVKSTNESHKLPCPSPIRAGDFFRKFADLQGPLKKSVIKKLAKLVKNEETAKELNKLADKDGEKLLADMGARCFGILDILVNYSIKLDISDFMEINNNILPRYYTISSSAKVNPRILSITMSMDYTEVGTEKKMGLASAYFQRLQAQWTADPAQRLTMRIQTQDSTFHLPTEKGTDCMFVSTGAGFAPFMGMAHEKEFLVTEGSNPYGEIDIFFGCRNADEDYIFKKEIRRLQGSNIIRTTHEAFSRQDPHHKVYVQHVFEQQKDKVMALLNSAKGIIYVCGNVGMSKSIKSLLTEWLIEASGGDEKTGKAKFSQLEDKKRICIEAWG